MVISNTNLLQMCKDCGAVGFVPAISYVYDAGAGTITLTNTSTIPSGDTYLKTRYQVHDFFGAEVRGTQTVKATANVIDVSTLDRSKPLMIVATILTIGMIQAVGSASGYVQAAGNISFFDVQKNA